MEPAQIRSAKTVPVSLIVVVLAIGALGISNVYSAARLTYPDLWMAQSLWLVLGVAFALVSLFLDYHRILALAYPVYVATVGLLVMVPVFGRKILGAKRWLNFGFGNFQPSELMKIAIIFVLARFFAEERRDEGYTISDLVRPMNVSRPIGGIAALIYFWKKNAWLSDPLGELARRVAAASNGQLAQWEESYLFRVIILTFVVVYLAVGGYLYRQRVATHSSLDERAAGRRRLAQVMWLVPPLLVLLLTLVFWNSEWVGDPKAVLSGWLALQGSEGGAFYNYDPTIWFRLTLLFALVVYLVACLLWGGPLSRRRGKKIRASSPNEKRQWGWVLAPVDLVLIAMGLIAIEPDLGTTLLVGAVAFSMILFVGMRFVSVLLLAVTGVGLGYLSWFALLKDYQKQRVLTFLDPDSDALGTGYHANQSMIAVGSGRFTGKGFASGTQSQLRFLPEQHTDFAFSVWSEEHGFVGDALLIVLYFGLVWAMVNVAAKSRDKFGALLVTGFCALVFWQAFVNMGMVIGLLPIVGVPLPLFSYGGSSLLTVMIGLAVTLNVASRSR